MMQKAKKHDQEKPRYSTVPIAALNDVIKSFTYGAQKYDDYNYSKGMNHSRYLNAAMRHINAYWMGEDMDESGNTHLANAVASLLMLMDSKITGVGTDDRNPKYLELYGDQNETKEN